MPKVTRDEVKEKLSELISVAKKEERIESTANYELVLCNYMNETLRSRFNRKIERDGKETPSLLAIPSLTEM